MMTMMQFEGNPPPPAIWQTQYCFCHTSRGMTYLLTAQWRLKLGATVLKILCADNCIMSKRVKCCNLPWIYLAQLISSLCKPKKFDNGSRSIFRMGGGAEVRVRMAARSELLSGGVQLHHEPLERRLQGLSSAPCLWHSEGHRSSLLKCTAQLLPSHVASCSLLPPSPFHPFGQQGDNLKNTLVRSCLSVEGSRLD